MRPYMTENLEKPMVFQTFSLRKPMKNQCFFKHFEVDVHQCDPRSYYIGSHFFEVNLVTSLLFCKISVERHYSTMCVPLAKVAVFECKTFEDRLIRVCNIFVERHYSVICVPRIKVTIVERKTYQPVGIFPVFFNSLLHDSALGRRQIPLQSSRAPARDNFIWNYTSSHRFIRIHTSLC